jgi:dihydrofolate reductase
MAADKYSKRNSDMKNRMIGVLGAFDKYGLYGIGPHIPWGTPEGRSHLKLDMGRFVLVSRTSAPKGMRNTLIVGRDTAEAMGMHPLPGRRMIILSRTLDESMLNGNPTRTGDNQLYVARNAQQAVERACSFEDGGHVFFAGGYEVWLQGLTSGFCTHAFITVVKTDARKHSTFTGEPKYAPEMLHDETFVGMKRSEDLPSADDIWKDMRVELEFRNYANA